MHQLSHAQIHIVPSQRPLPPLFRDSLEGQLKYFVRNPSPNPTRAMTRSSKAWQTDGEKAGSMTNSGVRRAPTKTLTTANWSPYSRWRSLPFACVTRTGLRSMCDSCLRYSVFFDELFVVWKGVEPCWNRPRSRSDLLCFLNTSPYWWVIDGWLMGDCLKKGLVYWRKKNVCCS